MKLSEREDLIISPSGAANQRVSEGWLPGELRQEAEAKGAKRAGRGGPSLGDQRSPGGPSGSSERSALLPWVTGMEGFL